MDKFLKTIGLIVVAIGGLALIECCLAFPVKWLVNYLITPGMIRAIFKTSELSFWQALCLTWLCGILFKSWTSSSSK